MIRQNLHMHSCFDDGRDGCREMLLACKSAGMTSAGMSLHSPMPFANDWAAQSTGPFLKEMNVLKEAFSGEFTVFSGIELDLLSVGTVNVSEFDYVIGSVHHLPLADIPPSLDESPEATRETLTHYFEGNADALAEMYFAEMQKLAEVPEVDICGHFDLITKFDEKCAFFDTESTTYRTAAVRALDAIMDAGKIFEVNTGAISRGWRTVPYPSEELIRRIAARSGRITVTSDAHNCDAVACAFRETEEMLLSLGVREIWQLFRTVSGCEFRPVPLGH